MSLVVNSNINAMLVKNNLQAAAGDLRQSMQRLSSGLKINTAGDDAAGLSLSQKLSSQINASDVAKNNTQTGVNMLQVMDADLSKTSELMQRMRELAVQSSNGVYSATERTALHSEFNQLRTEITRIGTSSQFSSISLLNASGTIDLQVGTDNVPANDRITINTIDAKAAAFAGLAAATIGTTAAAAQSAIGVLDAAITTVASNRATIGATINRLQGTIERIDSRKLNLESARSVIVDADVATESAKLTRNQILQQAAASMLLQANQLPSLALKLIS